MSPLKTPNQADDTTRLASILAQLDGPRKVLELGCGAFAGALKIYSRGSEMFLLGMDRDPQRLSQAHPQVPDAWFLQADITSLPLSLTYRFDLVVVRHPDIDRDPGEWRSSLAAAPGFLATSGWLVVTTYSAAELEQIRGWLSLTELRNFPLDTHRLAAPGLQGRDAFVMCWNLSA